MTVWVVIASAWDAENSKSINTVAKIFNTFERANSFARMKNEKAESFYDTVHFVNPMEVED